MESQAFQSRGGQAEGGLPVFPDLSAQWGLTGVPTCVGVWHFVCVCVCVV